MSEPLTEAFKAAADIEANTPINIPGKIVDAATDIYVHHLEQQLAAVTAERDEHLSRLGDIVRRIGPARNPAGIREELERELRRMGS